MKSSVRRHARTPSRTSHCYWAYAVTKQNQKHVKDSTVTYVRSADHPVGALCSESIREGTLRSEFFSVTLIGVFKQLENDKFTQLWLCTICGDQWRKCLQLAISSRTSKSQAIVACDEIVAPICKQRGFDVATSARLQNCKQLPHVLKFLHRFANTIDLVWLLAAPSKIVINCRMYWYCRVTLQS